MHNGGPLPGSFRMSKNASSLLLQSKKKNAEYATVLDESIALQRASRHDSHQSLEVQGIVLASSKNNSVIMKEPEPAGISRININNQHPR